MSRVNDREVRQGSGRTLAVAGRPLVPLIRVFFSFFCFVYGPATNGVQGLTKDERRPKNNVKKYKKKKGSHGCSCVAFVAAFTSPEMRLLSPLAIYRSSYLSGRTLAARAVVVRSPYWLRSLRRQHGPRPSIPSPSVETTVQTAFAAQQRALAAGLSSSRT